MKRLQTTPAMAKPEKPLIDEKLARELYKPPRPESPAAEPQLAKASLQRFQVLEQLIRDNPANPQSYSELAEIYLAKGRLKDATRILQQAVQNGSDHEGLLFHYEDVRLQLSHASWQAALVEYDRYDTEANRQECRRGEAEYFALQHAVGEARYQRHPNNPDWLILSAAALRRLGRGSEAIERLEPLKSDPRVRPHASILLGQCLEEAGQVVEALAAYRRAAIFRTPAPPVDIKRLALRRAADLAARHSLFASAAKYVELLLAELATDSGNDAARAASEIRQLHAAHARYTASATAQRSGEPATAQRGEEPATAQRGEEPAV